MHLVKVRSPLAGWDTVASQSREPILCKLRGIQLGKLPALGITNSTAGPDAPTTFSDLLSQAMNSLQDLGAKSDQLTVDAALGKPVELHQVMLAATKAQLAMDLFIQVRNRLIDSYQEISRMSV